jgi:predicted RNA binding protein YcfA (HicA-like mRNA interferase family)
MVSRLANFSGNQVIKILQKYFKFELISQKGSHVKLRKSIENKKITTIVPIHNELAEGTLHNILRQAQIDIENFIKYK